MKSKKSKQYSIIHSLDKGLYLLEILEQAGQSMSLQELWLKLKWDKATIYRLLTTLEKRGSRPTRSPSPIPCRRSAP